MSTVTTLQIVSSSSNDSEKLGEQLGKRLRGNEVIELVSDLGGGKTTFVRGLAHGAGSPDMVASPSFTISKVYKSDKFDLHHFDFYRLNDAGLLEHELHDELGDPKTVVIVEWGDAVRHVLPENRLTIKIKKTGEETREFELICPKSLEYLVENL